MVNWSAALEAVQGDQKLLRKRVKTSLAESSALMTEMRRAFGKNDFAELHHAAQVPDGCVAFYFPRITIAGAIKPLDRLSAGGLEAFPAS